MVSDKKIVMGISPLKLLSQSQLNFAEMILGGPLPKFCPAFQTSDQDGHHSRT
jgi:hypothetical protein